LLFPYPFPLQRRKRNSCSSSLSSGRVVYKAFGPPFRLIAIALVSCRQGNRPSPLARAHARDAQRACRSPAERHAVADRDVHNARLFAPLVIDVPVVAGLRWLIFSPLHYCSP